MNEEEKEAKSESIDTNPNKLFDKNEDNDEENNNDPTNSYHPKQKLSKE
jgi:hypothetical protein